MLCHYTLTVQMCQTRITSDFLFSLDSKPGAMRKSANPEGGKKRLAYRPQTLVPTTNVSRPPQHGESQRRPPPPLPGIRGKMSEKKASMIRPPPVPMCPRPRPLSEFVQMPVHPSLKNSKSISVGDVSQVSAEGCYDCYCFHVTPCGPLFITVYTPLSDCL